MEIRILNVIDPYNTLIHGLKVTFYFCATAIIVLAWIVIVLVIQLDKYKQAIRKHRDQRLDDRCWMDDFELYASLPEGLDPRYVDLRQLPKEEMMRNCDHFTTYRGMAVTPEEAIRMYANITRRNMHENTKHHA